MTALKQTLSERFETREHNDILRVEQVVELAEDPGCIVRRLLAHFGEDLGRDCGHCSVCLGEPARSISAESPPAPAFDGSAIRELRRAHPEALATPRRVARFLCGLTSPLLTTSKLSKHPLFGTSAGVPFREVMAAAS
jgi:ATP-dependent DNA helicase RecQ